MSGSRTDASTADLLDGGEFLLSLLQRPHPQTSLQPRQAQPLTVDPAVTAVGPTLQFPAHRPPGGHDQFPLWMHNPSSPFPHSYPHNYVVLPDDLRRLGSGMPGINSTGVAQQQEQKLRFGSFSLELDPSEGVPNGNSIESSSLYNVREVGSGSRNHSVLERNRQVNLQGNFDSRHHGRGMGGLGNHSHIQGVNVQRSTPPGFSAKPLERNNGGLSDNGRRFEHNVGERTGNFPDSRHSSSNVDLERSRGRRVPFNDHRLHEIEESLSNLHLKSVKEENRAESEKEYRSDSRGQRMLNQRMRNLKRFIDCRSDINRLSSPFLQIYESLIPPDEEKAKQKQLLSLLQNLVNKEWPEARLYLYGSCASSFGVCKSDIDVCLAFEDAEVDKSEVILKLAEIFEADNLQNVQALTRARVPIVKLMDPVTGISCDICINNVLAVVNTKLLRDYAQIDERLRQLAYIVKHWAKSRGVNQTYHGTLSSYAYVLMCIHFLQQRRPAILPCLQEMDATYNVTVDDTKCSFFDQVEKLRNFGSRNKESISQLVWSFFNYWAYRHDYTNTVISVRTGSLLSKQSKDWTRRVGNDRHLICIEDPFDTSHDLGRVVDKFSIRVLREEFERAAEIMQYDPNPCVTLFHPYTSVSS